MQLAGRHNLTNAILAAHAAERLGVTPEVVARGLSAVAGVPGHFELVRAGQPFVTVVDFAHTPGAVAAALEHGSLTCGRLGPRDRRDRLRRGS